MAHKATQQSSQWTLGGQWRENSCVPTLEHPLHLESPWHPIQTGEDQTGMRQDADSTLSTYIFPARLVSDLISIWARKQAGSTNGALDHQSLALQGMNLPTH